MSDERYGKKFYNDKFFLFEPLPKYLNTLENIDFIQFQGIRFQRSTLYKNNSTNSQQLIYNLDACKLNKKKNENEDSKDIYIAIKQDEDVDDDISSKDIIKANSIKSNQSSNKVSIYEEISLDKNNDFNFLNENENLSDRIFFKDKKKSCLIPPKRISSIFIDIPNNNINIKDTFYNNINNLIFNNLNEIKLLINNNIYKYYEVQQYNNNIFEREYPYLPYYYIEPKIKTFYSSYINKINSNKSSKPLFKVREADSLVVDDEIQKVKSILQTKRGRKEKKCNKKIHHAYDDDNILRKIQVHFLSFLTNFVNDIIRAFSNNKKVPYFRNIDYEIKKTVNHKYVEELKSKCIGELLQLRVSPKMKNHDDSVNKDIYQTVISSFPFMYGFLQRSYLSLFKEYYYNKNKIFIVNGKLITLSIKTRTFNDLINKNYAYREKLTSIAINFFLNHYKRYKKPNFIIKSMKKKNKKSEK